MYTGQRFKRSHFDMFKETKLRDKIFDCNNDSDMIIELESKGYYYLGTNDYGEIAFIKVFDGYDEFISCRKEPE